MEKVQTRNWQDVRESAHKSGRISAKSVLDYQDQMIRDLFSIPIIESDLMPPGQVMVFNADSAPQLWVNGMWQSIQWPMFVADQRKKAFDHLARLVKDAERRLGLSESRK